MTASTLVSVTSSDPQHGRRGAQLARRALDSCVFRLCSAGLLWLALAVVPALAENVYQQPDQFLSDTFHGTVPEARMLWLTGDLRDQAEDILGHPPAALRERYWLADGRSAWVLEEIGKDRPITVGLVVGERGIERIKVLVFRESRGWEVRYPFFTDQFVGASLDPQRQLDRNIDGISGATLSVRALKKLARLALLLHAQATETP